MNFEYLNEMTRYIEQHLTEEISYKELARIVGVSEYSLQRIFMFLTNYSIAEYIRKRRLSKAFEELKTTDIKIIDLAIKYQYDSSISFARAFKNTFGITPSECREGQGGFKQFPVITFNENNDATGELNYEMKNIDEITIYCLKVQANTHDDFLFKIRELYKNIDENGLYKKFNEVGQYAVSYYNGNEYVYLVGCKTKYKDTEEIVILKGKYAIFNVGSREQKDIIETNKIIYTKWLQSTSYKVDEDMNIEVYTDDNCYIYIPII